MYETEKDFAQAVVEMAVLCGWLVFRTWDSRHSPAGEPDLRMFHPGQKRVVFAELKVGRRGVTPHQEHAIGVIRSCGIPVYVWRPEDWTEIEQVLMGKREGG